MFENYLIAALADQDRCVTKAYDARLANDAPKAVLEACRMSELHQHVLDCGATFTNELYKLTQPTFAPFTGQFEKTKSLAERRINDYCVEKTVTKPSELGPSSPAPPAGSTSAPIAALPPASSAPAVSTPAKACP